MAAYAETNRIPSIFRKPNTELVAGYHTEYSAMKFAMFFMAEYANMVTVACLATLLFFGGWHGPITNVKLLQPITAAVLGSRLRFRVSLFIYLGARHVAAFPLRPVDGVWLEVLLPLS